MPYLRSLIVSTILSNPHQWTAAILGRSSAEYVETMKKVDTWGGAIELAIFSGVYRVEIVSIDVGTGRMDRFGEGEGYSDQVFLVYSGIRQSTPPYHLLRFLVGRESADKLEKTTTR